MEKVVVSVCAMFMAAAAIVYLSDRAANQPTEMEKAVGNFADSVERYQETQRLLNGLD